MSTEQLIQTISLIFYLISYVLLLVAYIYNCKNVVALKGKLRKQNTEKDLKLLNVLYNVKELTDYRKTFSKEAIRDYVNFEIEELSKNAQNNEIKIR